MTEFTKLPKPPKGAGALVLYFDFDGVLHHENVLWHPKRGPYIGAQPHYKLFQHAQLLEGLLSPYPEVKIVLSTTWARTYGFHRAAKMLPAGLRDRVIGATFHTGMFIDEFLAGSRGMQVWGDVVRRKPRDWIALDDDHVDWPKWCQDNYIQTHEHEGISEPAVLARIKEGLARLGTTS